MHTRPHPLVALTTLFTLLSLSLSAQVFREGQHSLSVGYGVGSFISTINATFDGYMDLRSSSTGPVFAKYEYGITEHIGFGLNVAYGTNTWEYRYRSTDPDGVENTYSEKAERTHYSLLARLNVHFGNEERFDPYLGFGMGYRNADWKLTTNDPYGTSGISFKGFIPLGLELTVGARYFFTEHIGLYAELGAAKSVAQGGLTVRF